VFTGGEVLRDAVVYLQQERSAYDVLLLLFVDAEFGRR